jgi:phosphoserine phosphatase
VHIVDLVIRVNLGDESIWMRDVARDSEERPRFLVSLDLDGTLTRDETVCQHIARALSRTEAIDGLVEGYEHGQITNRQFIIAFARWMEGITTARIRELLGDIATLKNIGEGVEALHAAGAIVILNTITWAFAAEFLAERWNLDAYNGWSMAIDSNGRFSGQCEQFTTEVGKVHFLEFICSSGQIARENTVHVGDSSSDVPAFGWVRWPIALNMIGGNAATRLVLRTTDFLDVVDVICRVVG